MAHFQSQILLLLLLSLLLQQHGLFRTYFLSLSFSLSLFSCNHFIIYLSFSGAFSFSKSSFYCFHLSPISPLPSLSLSVFLLSSHYSPIFVFYFLLALKHFLSFSYSRSLTHTFIRKRQCVCMLKIGARTY